MLNNIIRSIILIAIMITFNSCEGLMWDGTTRHLETDTVNITIRIDDPILIYRFYDEFIISEEYINGESFELWVKKHTNYLD